MNAEQWRRALKTEAVQRRLEVLYGPKAEDNLQRYEQLIALYRDTFGDVCAQEGGIRVFSAPGRTEIGGNHTDHQHGRVLAAAVDMDMIAAAAPSDDGIIRVLSEGFPLCEISAADTGIRESENNTTAALIRGIAAAFREMGAKTGGFRAVVKSSVLPGSGISSSAAFEVLIGTIINALFYEGKADPVRIAQIGQYAENVYFGKPSGLMDQMASSVGNILTIDFADPREPAVQKLDVSFDQSGLALCIIDSGADHAALTDEYAAITSELKNACAVFGKEVLREIPEEAFLEKLAQVRSAAGDRAVLRSLHYYEENARAGAQVKALEDGDIQTFLRLVKESGQSSWMYLQNISPTGSTVHQDMAVTLGICSLLLGGRGACRVHGGGFAGTCQAFVPEEMLDHFRKGIDTLLGPGRCHVLRIRPEGGTEILPE